jgi:hypothetical protein
MDKAKHNLAARPQILHEVCQVKTEVHVAYMEKHLRLLTLVIFEHRLIHTLAIGVGELGYGLIEIIINTLEFHDETR